VRQDDADRTVGGSDVESFPHRTVAETASHHKRLDGRFAGVLGPLAPERGSGRARGTGIDMESIPLAPQRPRQGGPQPLRPWVATPSMK
jgi:hypothetical protein